MNLIFWSAKGGSCLLPGLVEDSSRVHAGRQVDHPIISFGLFEMIGLCKDWRQPQTLDIFLVVVRAFDLLFAVGMLKDFLQI